MANTSILAAFERMWQHIVTALAKKSDVGHIHSDATQSTSGFLSAEDKTQLDNGGIPIVPATSADGVIYTAAVDGVTTLVNGMKLTIIPNATSTDVSVKLNLNGLGDKYIRMPIAYNSTASSAGAIASWIGKNKPITLEYDGTYFKAISMPRQSALYLYGTVPVSNGGTGAESDEEARENLGVYSMEHVDNIASNVDNIAKESTSHLGCFYRTVNGETEWLNPPMIVNTEYKTVERYHGKPVYVKEFAFGTLPNATYKNYHTDVQVQEILYANLAIKEASSGRTFAYATSDVNCYAGEDSGGNMYIIIESPRDSSTYNGFVTVKYTKLTDTAIL